MDKAYHPAILYRTAEDFYEFAVAHCVEETLQIEVDHIDVAIIDYFVESLDSYWIFHIAHIFPQSYIFSTKLPNDYSYLFNNDKYFRNTDGWQGWQIPPQKNRKLVSLVSPNKLAPIKGLTENGDRWHSYILFIYDLPRENI